MHSFPLTHIDTDYEICWTNIHSSIECDLHHAQFSIDTYRLDYAICWTYIHNRLLLVFQYQGTGLQCQDRSWWDYRMYVRYRGSLRDCRLQGYSSNVHCNWNMKQSYSSEDHCEIVSLQWHHNGAMASQITSPMSVYSTVYSGADQRKHQSSASLAIVRGIHRWPVNSPHKWPVTQKIFPSADIIMWIAIKLIVTETDWRKSKKKWRPSNHNDISRKNLRLVMELVVPPCRINSLRRDKMAAILINFPE